MSRTRKPCPGCGEVDPSRAAAEVCHVCRRDLAYARDRRPAETDARLVRAIQASLDGVGYEVSRALVRLASAVGEKTSTPAPFDPPKIFTRPGSADPWPSGCSYVVDDALFAFPVAVAASLQALLETVAEALDDARRRGFDEGANLLHRLATGDARSTDYDQEIARGDGRVPVRRPFAEGLQRALVALAHGKRSEAIGILESLNERSDRSVAM